MTDASGAAAGPEPIAIIAMAGRFPGADTVPQFWANLRAGTESVSRLRASDLLLADHDPEHVLHPRFVGAEGVLTDPALFDAGFFGYSPREASVMDPQHRIALELAWELFDSVGYDPARLDAHAGVFVSAGLSAYLVRNLLAGDRAGQRAAQQEHGLHLLMHNDKDFAATTISYQLGLTGPSFAVGSACSSSLVAVHLACQSLQSHECDLAVAGGVYVQIPHGSGYVHTDDGVYSPDGRCAAFDASASGTVGGSGAGMVLLKRLSEAVRDRDHLDAVILGSAVGNDGAAKIGYTAPSVPGQAGTIMEAHAVAGVPADTIGYVEAHGTGTRLGDPVEVEALTQAFSLGTTRRQFCALGSVKASIGHLDAAAGIVGLIKAALVVRDGEIPASLHYRRPSPAIDFAATPFYVAAAAARWPDGSGPRRAGVSSFGIGGTNAHLVLEEPPPAARPPGRAAGPPGAEQILPLSARSPQALAAVRRELAEFLAARPEADLADVAGTLAGRRALPCRQAVTARGSAAAARVLAEPGDAEEAVPGREAVFLFPGQGMLDADAVLSLRESEPVFARHLGACAGLLAEAGFSLQEALRPGAPAPAAQPALVAVEYALASTLIEWGVQPAAMLGHSLGEYTAATLAGVFSLADVLRLVVARAKLCERLPAGRMLAVGLAEEQLLPLLPGGVELAAVNAPDRCVVAGRPAALGALAARLREGGTACRPLPVARAFHTADVEPIREAFAGALRDVQLAKPERGYVSSVTGTWADADDVCRPGYWLEHLRQPVRFAEAAGACLGLGPAALIEAGPPQGLGRLARRQPGFHGGHQVQQCLPAAPDQPAGDPSALSLAPVAARLWAAGCDIDLATVRPRQQPRRLSLPASRLHRQRHWVDPPPRPVPLPPVSALAAGLRETPPPESLVCRGIDDYPGLRAGLDGLCAQAATWLLARRGIGMHAGARYRLPDLQRRLGILPQFTRMLGVLLDAMAAAGLLTRAGDEVTMTAEPGPGTADGSNIRATVTRLTREHPGFAGLAELLLHCAEGYPSALTEPGEALRLLYPDGRADLLTRTLGGQTVPHRGVGQLTWLTGELLERLSGELRRPVRVLEAGAGEGALTEALAGRLGRGRLIYHATDISPGFVSNLAAQARQRQLDWVRTSRFDITEDPARQGLAGHRYDLVCGLDVLHATADLRRSLAHLRSLLAPGGLLALVETTAADRWLSLIWGLSDGWWSYTDQRSSGPLLDAAGWDALIGDMNFENAEIVVPRDGPRDAALVLAQEPGRSGASEAGHRARPLPPPDQAAEPAAGGAVSLPGTADAWPAKRPDLASWCYRPGWGHLPPAQRLAPPAGGCCLLLSAGPLGTAVAGALTGLGVRVVTVTPEQARGHEPVRPGQAEDTRILDPADAAQYYALVGGLAAAGTPVRLIVHLWALEEALGRGRAADARSVDRAQLHGLHSLLQLAQALGAVAGRDPVRLVTVTCGAQDVLGDEVAFPEQATVTAAVKVIPREYPWIACTAVDILPGAPPAGAGALIADELLGARESAVVAYRGRRRFGPQYAAGRLGPLPPGAPPPAGAGRDGVRPRPGGRYLICGGLGGIGLSIAEHLGRTPARLVLTSRREFPPPEQWAARAGAGDQTARTARRLLDLQAAGAQVMVMSADVSDLGQMRAVVEGAEREYGGLDGVVHAAGVLDLAGMIQRRTRDQTAAAIRAKTAGTLVLHEVTAARPLDFFVLCSSIGTVLHKLKFGEVGYVAGNEFVNSFAEYRASRHPGLSLAIAWSDWLGEGMWASAMDRLAGRYAVSGGAGFGPADDILGGITRDEGVEIFARLAGHGVAPRAVVSTQDLDVLLARHDAFSTDDHLRAVSRLSVAGGREQAAGHPPAARGGRPAGEVQRTVAGFWSTLLGVPQIGPADDFFDLGGDSLLALRLLAMVRDEYGVDVPVARVFESPTLAGLSAVLDQARAAGDGARHEEVVL
jgi:nonribosomal peptide synthetase protein BlmVIII